ncbi:AAA family ATPase [Lacticaseibacillus mingshuiensis]|uniref:AAA family ATPase n=1 Tax=Lacticaseibacillus mingshuiensis TaxID=2799574 RepID=A0ABW4CH75_9LACO|nr:AAA family ATPase [Lacticaseibacillus mingshuiensis]
MQYLESFRLPDEDAEWQFFVSQKSRAFSDYYPFQIFPDKQLTDLSFEPVTILYGDNGSGKSTLLNIIAEKLGLARAALYNRSSFFEDYLARCDFQLARALPAKSAIITSDEVFDAMLHTRALNQGIDDAREDMFKDYLQNKFGDFHYHDLSDYDELKKVLETRRKTQSRYVRDNLAKNAREYSNGESAMQYFQDKLQDDQLYLLDEPENSLSPTHQQELAKLLTDSARFFGDQFIIATHSPFVLAIPHAKIYDLDSVPVRTKKWQALPEVQAYAAFFREHQDEFE